MPGYARAVHIVDGARSPFLKARGRTGPFAAAEIATQVGRALLARQPFDPTALDEVVLGCVMPGPDEANIARVVGLRLGVGERTPAYTVQRNCASGLQALDSAAEDIASGRCDLVLAGGVEAMSHAPVLLAQAMVDWLGRWRGARSLPQRLGVLARLRLRHLAPVIGLLRGLTDPIVGLSMGQTAELLAQRFGISRRAMDEFALASHQRLAAAQDAGILDEIEPLYSSRGEAYVDDDGLRRDSSLEDLARLRPVFDRPYGDVTAGNSAQVTDGGAWLLLASDAALARYGLSPRARLHDVRWAGLDPSQMGLGPVHAMAPLLDDHGLGAGDIDYWEINEAFAAQVLACLTAWQDPDYQQELGREVPFAAIPHERLNIDGGGVSLGHPVGASGARIVLHLVAVLERQAARRGVASLCIGGGQGGAALIERAA